MEKLKNLMLDLLLVFLVITMIVLLIFNWSHHLNINAMPTTNYFYNILAEKFLESSKQIATNEVYSVVPEQIIIKEDDQVSAIIYSDSEILAYYDLIKADLKSEQEFSEISYKEYVSLLENDQFVLLKFNAPSQSIFENAKSAFVSDVIIANCENTTVYVRSDNTYYKSDSTNINIPKTDGFTSGYKFASLESSLDPFSLLTTDTKYISQISTSFIDLDVDLENKIMTEFLYNPNFVTRYKSNQGEINEVTVVNEYSTLQISQKNVQFETSDDRGNLFYIDQSLTVNQMISFAVSIFDELHIDINSELKAYPVDIKTNNDQTIIVLGAKINSIPYYYDNYAGCFIFNNKGLIYADVNLNVANTLESSSILEQSMFFESVAPKNSAIELIYKDDTAQWVFKTNKEN